MLATSLPPGLPNDGKIRDTTDDDSDSSMKDLILLDQMDQMDKQKRLIENLKKKLKCMTMYEHNLYIVSSCVQLCLSQLW